MEKQETSDFRKVFSFDGKTLRIIDDSGPIKAIKEPKPGSYFQKFKKHSEIYSSPMCATSIFLVTSESQRSPVVMKIISKKDLFTEAQVA